MDGFYFLVALSTGMFIGSFFVGLIPLAISMSEGRIRLLSFFGAGLLVGTALSVIIPEGVESIYMAETEKLSLDLSAENVVKNDERNVENKLKEGEKLSDSNLVVHSGKKEDPISHHILNKRSDSRIKTNVDQKPINSEEVAEKSFGHHRLNVDYIGKSMGFSLVMGFIFMLIVDQVTRSASYKGSERLRYKLTATIGLVVHAAADGIAMGSASSTNRTDIQFIVFFAVMLHKAPAAFGLVSFLLVEGVERFRIRRHLFAFSIAAPATALITYYLIAVLGRDSISPESSTGILMLFSAGTFLYVATVHILPELFNSGADYQVFGGTDGVSHIHSSSGAPLAMKELASIIIGVLCPAILAGSHSH